jgi:hypothetical protein
MIMAALALTVLESRSAPRDTCTDISQRNPEGSGEIPRLARVRPVVGELDRDEGSVGVDRIDDEGFAGMSSSSEGRPSTYGEASGERWIATSSVERTAHPPSALTPRIEASAEGSR